MSTNESSGSKGEFEQLGRSARSKRLMAVIAANVDDREHREGGPMTFGCPTCTDTGFIVTVREGVFYGSGCGQCERGAAVRRGALQAAGEAASKNKSNDPWDRPNRVLRFDP